MTVQDRSAETVIQAGDISKTFGGIVALQRVSLTVNRNEIFGLLGPNGSGKTTLLRILATLVRPDLPSSRVQFKATCNVAGYDLFTQADKVRHEMGYVPQRDALYNDLSAEDNMMFFSAPYHVRERRKRILELLGMVGLYDRRRSLVGTFSGGMLRRLSIACALVHEPQVVIFDEATVGLDAETRHGVWDLMRQLKQGRAIVVTTHLMSEAEENCDRAALLFHGEVVGIGTPMEIVANNGPARDLDEAVRIIQSTRDETGWVGHNAAASGIQRVDKSQ